MDGSSPSMVASRVQCAARAVRRPRLCTPLPWPTSVPDGCSRVQGCLPQLSVLPWSSAAHPAIPCPDIIARRCYCPHRTTRTRCEDSARDLGRHDQPAVRDHLARGKDVEKRHEIRLCDGLRYRSSGVVGVLRVRLRRDDPLAGMLVMPVAGAAAHERRAIASRYRLRLCIRRPTQQQAKPAHTARWRILANSTGRARTKRTTWNLIATSPL